MSALLWLAFVAVSVGLWRAAQNVKRAQEQEIDRVLRAAGLRPPRGWRQ